MATRRSYGDSCGLARALDVIGERWSLLLVRELLFGPKRFTDLRKGLPTASPDILVDRLRELEHSGVIVRESLPPPAASRVYALTDRGRELESALVALARWGSGTALATQSRALSPDAFVLALETLFDPESSAVTGPASYELQLGEYVFAIHIEPGGLTIRPGHPEGRAARIVADTATLAAVLWHAGSASEAESAGRLTVTGIETRRDLFQKWRAFFPAPRTVNA